MSPPQTPTANITISNYNIVTPRLILRNAIESDLDAYHELRTNPANSPFETSPQTTVEALRPKFLKLQEETLQGKFGFLVFTLRETGQVMGFGGYNPYESVEPREFLSDPNLPPGEKLVADVGVTIDHRFWRKGYGLEALCAMLEYGHDALGCELFLLETDIANEPYRRIMSAACLGAYERRTKDDDGDEQWSWRFSVAQWDRAKTELTQKSKWTL